MKFLKWLLSLFNDTTPKPQPEQPKEPATPQVPSEPYWMIAAKQELGQKEWLTGKNPRIAWYHSFTNAKGMQQNTPWCSSFVNAMLGSGIGTGKANARSFLHWGQELKQPKYGCIVVFSRPPKPHLGHVGFYVSEDEKNIQVLSGNQNDSVCYKYYPKSRLLGYRWPIDK